jgi:hypothetical protein
MMNGRLRARAYASLAIGEPSCLMQLPMDMKKLSRVSQDLAPEMPEPTRM